MVVLSPCLVPKTRSAVRCPGYDLRLTEWHHEEVSRVLSTEDGLPEKEQWVQSRDAKQTSLEQVGRRDQDEKFFESFVPQLMNAFLWTFTHPTCSVHEDMRLRTLSFSKGAHTFTLSGSHSL